MNSLILDGANFDDLQIFLKVLFRLKLLAELNLTKTLTHL